MATNIPPVSEEDILLCCICLETLEEPKILGCLHRFCKKCLKKVIEKVPSDKNSFQCPTCRHDQSLPENGVDGVSGDFLLRGILENRKLEKDIKNEKKDQTCSSCKRFTSVIAICPHCGGFICETCHTAHILMKIFEDHTHMVTLEDIESGKVTFDAHSMKTISNTPKCHSHKDMTLHINCKTCDQLICPVCAPLHHQGHEFEEIHAAAERIKETIGALVQESREKEEMLMKGLEKINTMRDELNMQVSGVKEKVADISGIFKENVKNRRQKDLEELEEKKRQVKREAEKNLAEIDRERKFVEEEMIMVQDFIQQSLECAKADKQDTIRKVKDCQTTAGILTKDTDNWSLIKAAPDVQRVLKVERVDMAVQHFEDVSLERYNFSRSVMTGQCWKWGKYKKSFQKKVNSFPGANYWKVSISDLQCLEDYSELAVTAVRDGLRTCYIYRTVIAVVNLRKSEFRFQVEIARKYNKIFYAGCRDGTFYSVCTEADRTWVYHNGDEYGELDFPSKVSCCTSFPPNEKILIGLDGSTKLYQCDYEAEILSEITVQDDGFNPPVSLAVNRNGENIILCDGVSKALAVSGDGKVIAGYLGRSLTDKPLRIASGSNGLVYVLWDIKDGVQSMRGIKRGGTTAVDDESSDEDDDDDDIDLSMNRVIQYSAKGTYISEVYVNRNMTLMTTTVGDEGDVLVLASPNNEYEFFEMTSFGEKFSQFVQSKDGSETARAEDGK